MSFHISGSSEAFLSLSPRLIKELKDTLRPGQVVQGVVKSVISDNKYVLQVNGINTVGHTDIPLEEGQTFFAGVKELNDKIVLNFLSENDQMSFLKEDLVRRIKVILSQLNHSTDEMSLRSAVEFMKNGLPLDKQNFLSFIDQIKSEGITEVGDIRTAALLFKNNLPVSRDAIQWLKQTFEGQDVDGMLRSASQGVKEPFHLSSVIQNMRNVLLGLKDVTEGKASSIDIQSMQKVLDTLQVKGTDIPGDIEKDFTALIRNSGLNLESKLKDVFMKMTLTDESRLSGLKDTLQFLEGTTPEKVMGKSASSLLNYADFKEAFFQMKKSSADLFNLIKDMSSEEMGNALRSTEYGEYAAVVKEAAYSFLSKVFQFFKEFQKAIDLSESPPDKMPSGVRQLVFELMKSAGPFMNTEDKNFFQQFLDKGSGRDDFSFFKNFLKQDVLSFADSESRGMQNDLKNMLQGLMEKLDDFHKTLKQETLASDPSAKEVWNASQFTRENLLQIIREQISLRQNLLDTQEFRIVFPFMEGDQQRELNVFFKKDTEKGAGKKKKSFYDVVILLDLSKIGPVRVDMKLSGKQLECDFFTPDEKVVSCINDEIFQLEESFKGLDLEPVIRAQKKESLLEGKNNTPSKEDLSGGGFFNKIDITV